MPLPIGASTNKEKGDAVASPFIDRSRPLRRRSGCSQDGPILRSVRADYSCREQGDASSRWVLEYGTFTLGEDQVGMHHLPQEATQMSSNMKKYIGLDVRAH
jgi:hypothetical protein